MTKSSKIQKNKAKGKKTKSANKPRKQKGNVATKKKGMKKGNKKEKKNKTVYDIIDTLFQGKKEDVNMVEMNLKDLRKSEIPQEKKSKVVLIYMDGCIHCQNMMPTYLEYKKKRIDDGIDEDSFIEIERADLSDEKLKNEDINITMESIQGYPTLGVIKNGEFIKYEGERTMGAFSSGLL